MLPIRIEKSNVLSVGSSSERNRIYISFDITGLILYFDFVSLLCLRSTIRLFNKLVVLYLLSCHLIILAKARSFGSYNVYLNDTRISYTLLWLSSIDNECKCQILLLIYPYDTSRVAVAKKGFVIRIDIYFISIYFLC